MGSFLYIAVAFLYYTRTDVCFAKKIFYLVSYFFRTVFQESDILSSIGCQGETGLSKDPQLYNMDYDIGQQNNIAWDYADQVEKMEKRLQEILTSESTR